MDNQAQDQKDVGINYSWLVLDTVRRMRDAQAQGRYEEYYTQFEYGLQLLLPHIEIETRANIEEDFATLMEKLVSIRETEDNEQSKKVRSLALKVDFADTHRYFIMEALPRASIYKVSEEGVIDFNKHKLEETTEIIRNSGGLASTIARVAEKAQD